MAGSSKSAEGSHCTTRGGEEAAALVRSTGSLALPGSRTIVHTHRSPVASASWEAEWMLGS